MTELGKWEFLTVRQCVQRSVLEEKYVASVSFGKDSTAMLLRLIEEKKPLDEVVFYDTGMEFDCIYKIRDKLIPLMKENGIKYTELKPSTPFWIDMLLREKKKRTGQIVYGDGFCGGACRWHTFKKQKACNDYCKDCFVYIGIAVDEPKRLVNLDSNKIAPLAEWGMTENDCLEYCRDHGIEWIEDGVDLYSILDRVSCWCCKNKNLKELKNIYLYLPRYWKMLKGLQDKIDVPFKGEGKSIFELEERFKRETNDKSI